MHTADALEAAFATGKAAWPSIRLEFEHFADQVRQREVSPKDLEAQARDLYLAVACGRGDDVASRLLDKLFIQNVDGHLARTGVPPSWRSEVHQKVRLKLLSGGHPGITRYRGQAPLAVFVRVTAVRVGVDVATAAAAMNRRPDEDVLNLLISMDANPEVETARALYRERFRAVVEETLAGLSKRERSLLRLHFLDDLSIDAIAAIYRVHRATVARWLVAIRNRALGDIRSRLALHLGGTPSELRSLIKLLRDDIDVSARRILSESA
jgi:RNA polymerase sigma-70 factor, ECF subfamily